MATTTTEGTPSQADGHSVSGLPPAPFHLCFDWLDDGIDGDADPAAAILDCAFADGPDDDGFFADGSIVSDELSRSELIDLDAVLSTDNVRSHAEVPEPDGFGLPSHDCWIYRAVAPANVRTAPGEEPFIEAIVVSSTTLSELQFEALAVARRLQDAGALVLPFGAPRTRGMGRELELRVVRARPEIRGFWFRDLAEEALIVAKRRLPSPAPVPSESRAVRATELPVARWQRLNASAPCARTSSESARGAA